MGYRRLMRTFAAAALMLLVTVPAGGGNAAASASRAAHLSSAERAEVARIEEYLNSLSTVRAHFLQATSTGQFAEGELYLSRPGRLRIEYEPPVRVLIVADGTWLIYHDKELEQVSYVPLGSTPARILTKGKVSLSAADGEFVVTGFSRASGTIRLTVVQKKDPKAGSVTLVFNANPLVLKKWVVTDPQGVETDVSLVSARFDVPLNPKLFEFKDPRMFKDDL